MISKETLTQLFAVRDKYLSEILINMAYEDIGLESEKYHNQVINGLKKLRPKYRIKEYDGKFMPQRVSRLQIPFAFAEDEYVNIGTQWFGTIGEARAVLAEMEREDNLRPIYHPYP